MSSIGQQLLDVPFGEMILSLGSAIADAQFQLDLSSARIAQIMAGQTYEVKDADGNVVEKIGPIAIDIGGTSFTMLELGFTPTFYQFVDTIIEVKISISMTTALESSQNRQSSTSATVKAGGAVSAIAGGGKIAHATSVNAHFASKYQYHAEGSSLIRTKLVPLPPPALFEERIRALIAATSTPS